MLPVAILVILQCHITNTPNYTYIQLNNLNHQRTAYSIQYPSNSKQPKPESILSSMTDIFG